MDGKRIITMSLYSFMARQEQKQEKVRMVFQDCHATVHELTDTHYPKETFFVSLRIVWKWNQLIHKQWFFFFTKIKDLLEYINYI